MRTKHLLPVLLLLVACGVATAQSNDELPSPDDDNQFPPDNPEPEVDTVEGSGAGVLEGPLDSATESVSEAVLEDAEPTAEPVPAGDELLCPDTCTCSAEGEGDSYGYTVNCANKDLLEFPSNIDPKTTTLYLQNNKLTELPKSISDLKNLRVLNANDNSIMDITPGTISELLELKILKLANNRLLEYPQDLKNSFLSEKLEEFDISGNDIRSSLNVENFSNFVALKKVILPKSGEEIKETLCDTLKSSLDTVCIETCETDEFVCPNTPQNIGGDFLEAKLPGAIAFSNAILDVADPDLKDADNGSSTTTESQTNPDSSVTDSSKDDSATTPNLSASDFSLRNAVNNAEATADSGSRALNAVVESPVDTPVETDVKLGATTSDAKTGGVDKSVIGIIVAGMIVVVAAITIKKNWSSIRKRFSSSPRPANGVTANGNTPEEMPLQDKDKSPV